MVPAKAAVVAANAVGKAGQAIRKPVWGRERTLTYKTEIERDGKTVEAEVVERDSKEVGTLGVAVVVVAGAAVGLAVLGVASSTSKRLAKREGD